MFRALVVCSVGGDLRSTRSGIRKSHRWGSRKLFHQGAVCRCQGLTVSHVDLWSNDVLLLLSREGQCGGRAGPKASHPDSHPVYCTLTLLTPGHPFSTRATPTQILTAGKPHTRRNSWVGDHRRILAVVCHGSLN